MNIYENIFNILNEFIFNNSIIVGSGSALESALTLVSLCLCLFLVSIPFILVYRFIKLLGGE